MVETDGYAGDGDWGDGMIAYRIRHEIPDNETGEITFHDSFVSETEIKQAKFDLLNHLINEFPGTATVEIIDYGEEN